MFTKKYRPPAKGSSASASALWEQTQPFAALKPEAADVQPPYCNPERSPNGTTTAWESGIRRMQ